MKRYLLFTGDDYYPSGGWKDLSDSFDTVEDAKNNLLNTPTSNFDWYQIVDTTLEGRSKIVDEG